MEITFHINTEFERPETLKALAQVLLVGAGGNAKNTPASGAAQETTWKAPSEEMVKKAYDILQEARAETEIARVTESTALEIQQGGRAFRPAVPESFSPDPDSLDMSAGAQVAPAIIPPPPSAGPVQLDAAGLPWDERIHSSSKALVAGGVWRQRRNLDKSILASVEAELRLVYPAPASLTVGTPPVPVAPIEAIIPPPPANVPLPPSVPHSFTELMPLITEGVAKGTLTAESVAAACVAAGVENLPALSGAPLAVPVVFGILFGAE